MHKSALCIQNFGATRKHSSKMLTNRFLDWGRWFCAGAGVVLSGVLSERWCYPGSDTVCSGGPSGGPRIP